MEHSRCRRLRLVVDSTYKQQSHCFVLCPLPEFAMGDDLPYPPVEKISISGPSLASILQSFSSSHGDVDGLLFGHVTRLPPPELHDDDDNLKSSSSSATIGLLPSSSTSPIAATVSGHICFCSPSSFYDSIGRIDTRILTRALAGELLVSNSTLIGWFSGRRQSPLRPSMREIAVTFSLAKFIQTSTLDAIQGHPVQKDAIFRHPCVFMLLSTSSTGNLAVHTHEYRAFELRRTAIDGGDLVPRSVNVVNVGPAFRGHYMSFAAESGLPMLAVDGRAEADERSMIGMKNKQMLDRVTEGFGLDKLKRLVGTAPVLYRTEVEEVYLNILRKLHALATVVEESSKKVSEQEMKNLQLRRKIAGLE